jgi:tetratricopeptide (TPR) repeat protein
MANLDSVYAQRHYETALDLFEQGQYEKALAQLDKAIQKAPENPDYHSAKGVFLHRMNDALRAIDAYKDALKVDPEHSFSHFNLGLIYMRQNKAVQAITEWQEVIKVKPKDVDAIFNIAVALSHLGKSHQAIPFYEKVIKLQPDHVQAHQNLGVIFRDAGDFSKAKHHLQQLKNLDSTYVEVVENEITKCEEQEFLARLEAQKNTMVTEKTGREEAIENALMALLDENFDIALKLAEEAYAKDPDNLQAQLIIGQAQYGLSRNSDSIATFMRIVADCPDNIDALFNLGNIFLGMGELEKALDYFERISKLKPGHTLIKENISSIKAKLAAKKDSDSNTQDQDE